MDNEKLSELMRLREAATPGPWEVKLGDFVDDEEVITLHPYIEVNRQAICVPFERGPDDDNEEADIAFICAACNAVPEMVARIRELERICEQQQHRLDFKSTLIEELIKRNMISEGKGPGRKA